MDNKIPKVVIVMPAYNAARTVKDTYSEIPIEYRKDVILVDDQSSDDTVTVARKLGIKVFAHPNNLGYGGNQKTCYWEALKLKPDVVVMLHPDYQYDASLMNELVRPILEDRYDYVFGSRIATKKTALEGGMPPLKYYINRIVCFIQNVLLGVNFTEHFSGYRAYSTKLLKTIPFQRFSNDFVFDQEMTISSISYGMRIGEVAIPTRYHEKASSIQFFKGMKFIIEGFWVTAMLYFTSLGIVRDKRFGKQKKQGHKLLASILLVFGVSILNLLLHTLFRQDLLLGLLVVLESVFLYLAYKKSGLFSKLFVFFLLFLSIYIVLKSGFDKTLLIPSRLEADTLAKRKELFAAGYGKIYRNSIGIFYFIKVRPVWIKYVNNAFSFLDFNLVFKLKNIISAILIIPFFIGLVQAIRKINLVLVVYFAIVFLASGLLIPSNSYGFYLLSPVINVCISLGLIKLYTLIRK